MWIYQEGQERPERQERQQKLPEIRERPQPTPPVEAVVPAVQKKALPEEHPEQPLPPVRPARPRKKLFPASRDCILLAGVYLFGTFWAGMLQALCSRSEQAALAVYLSRWQELFSVSDPSGLPQLFGAEVWTVLGALSLLLLLGLSALGPVLIFFFFLLYGTGSGLILSQLMNGADPKSLLLILGVAGLPAAVAAGGLCLFGASALQVSSRIRAFSFGKEARRGESTFRAGAGGLTGQFVITAAAFLPLCGVATGLAYLVCRILS